MTDLEITLLCAEAMGLNVYPKQLVKGKLAVDGRNILRDGTMCQVFDPLNNDAQAMALVKRWSMYIDRSICANIEHGGYDWSVCGRGPLVMRPRVNANLNYAICEYAAMMQLLEKDRIPTEELIRRGKLLAAEYEAERLKPK